MVRLGKRQRQYLRESVRKLGRSATPTPIYVDNLGGKPGMADRLVELGLLQWSRRPGYPAAYLVPTYAGVREIVGEAADDPMWQKRIEDGAVAPLPQYRVDIRDPHRRGPYMRGVTFTGRGSTVGDAIHDAMAQFESYKEPGPREVQRKPD